MVCRGLPSPQVSLPGKVLQYEYGSCQQTLQLSAMLNPPSGGLHFTGPPCHVSKRSRQVHVKRRGLAKRKSSDSGVNIQNAMARMASGKPAPKLKIRGGHATARLSPQKNQDTGRVVNDTGDQHSGRLAAQARSGGGSGRLGSRGCRFVRAAHRRGEAVCFTADRRAELPVDLGARTSAGGFLSEPLRPSRAEAGSCGALLHGAWSAATSEIFARMMSSASLSVDNVGPGAAAA